MKSPCDITELLKHPQNPYNFQRAETLLKSIWWYENRLCILRKLIQDGDCHENKELNKWKRETKQIILGSNFGYIQEEYSNDKIIQELHKINNKLEKEYIDLIMLV